MGAVGVPESLETSAVMIFPPVTEILDTAGVTFTAAVTGVLDPPGVTSTGTFEPNATLFPVAVPDAFESVGTIAVGFDRGGVVVPGTATEIAFTGGDTTFWVEQLSITFTKENNVMESLWNLRNQFSFKKGSVR